MTTARLLLLAPALWLGACEGFPRDTAGTSDAVRGRPMRVGRVEGTPLPVLDRLVERVAERAGTTPEIIPGAAEPLLRELEAGRLDLVVGPFDRKTPWDARVTFSKPLRVTPPTVDPEIEAKAATRNGEHAWAMRVDRAVADVGEGEG